MKFKKQHQEEVSVDLTPFIDMVFMLLLFFVVSATFFKETTQLAVQLPEANADLLVGDNTLLEIGVDANGNYYINGVLVGEKLQALKKGLAVKLQENHNLSLILAGDKLAPHQAVVSALETAQALGITQVQIVAKQRST